MIHPPADAPPEISAELEAARERLIEAVATLRKRGHSIMVFLVGQGRFEEALRRLVRQRKLSTCVTFVQAIGDLSQVMRNADIFVDPSPDGAFVSHGLEAMGAGMVVVTVPNTICDYYRDGETVLLCEKTMSEAIAHTIEQLLRDRDRARRIVTDAME